MGLGRDLEREEDPKPEENTLEDVLFVMPGGHGGGHPVRWESWSRRVAARSARARIHSPRRRGARKIGAAAGTRGRLRNSGYGAGRARERPPASSARRGLIAGRLA